MTWENGFGNCSLFVLSANGWKDQNMDSSFFRQRKPSLFQAPSCFRFTRFNTFPLYYLRAWHRLKKTLIRRSRMGEAIVRLANRVAVWRQREVSIDFYKVPVHEVFSPERSLNQLKATRVCIRSINQSNRSISVPLLFLFCSRVFISRPYENRSIIVLTLSSSRLAVSFCPHPNSFLCPLFGFSSQKERVFLRLSGVCE